MKVIECDVRVIEIKRGMKLSEYGDLPKDKPLGLCGRFVFSYDYPLSKVATFEHNISKDMDGIDILLIGKKDYKRIYKEEDEDVAKPTPMIPGMLNRQTSNGRWGIWGHVIDDLFFESIEIDEKKKTISFGIGS